MSTDISRSAFDPRKRYTTVQLQQGRVILDADYNEGADIQEEDERRAMLDVIGPTGSSDGGFRISNGHLNEAGEIDFDIGEGTLWLGGLRLWNPGLDTYAAQDDWLQQPASERAAPATSGRIDLIYLEAWHQPVTAVEDEELLEPALASGDTSARVRLMRRIRIVPGVTELECHEAWTDLLEQWTTAHLGTVDGAGERRPNASLHVGFVDGAAGDLCSPPIAGGYLGAENQTIRVQLVDSSHLTWGFDNASPLYRVRVETDRHVIKLHTLPKDQAHWPRGGQVVEILASSAVLPITGTTAELSGFLTQVVSYDPDTALLELVDPVPAGFGEAWTGRYTFPSDPFLYLRVWNRGDDTTSPAAIPFTADTPVTLGTTGLTVTLYGTDFVKDDHWIIAVRPGAGGLIPLQFYGDRPPHGVRRFFTPLALVRWTGGGSSMSFFTIADCRVSFQPLTRLNGCCTYTVGDGDHSHGQFTSIQEAVNALPPAGGKVCVLPGTYPEQVQIFGGTGITIEGCGARSVIAPPSGSNAIEILGGQEITIRGLALQPMGQIGVVIQPAPPSIVEGGPIPEEDEPPTEPVSDFFDFDLFTRPRRILIEDVVITTQVLPAIHAVKSRLLTIRRNKLIAGPLPEPIGEGDPGRWPTIYLQETTDSLIEENEIVAQQILIPGADIIDSEPEDSTTSTFTLMPMGGIQLAGLCERIEILRNLILRGNGHGITLGSVAYVPEGTDLSDFEVMRGVWVVRAPGDPFEINLEGCVEISWVPTPPADDNGNPMIPVSMGPLQDIRIIDNEIREMGLSGIGVARYFVSAPGELDYIEVNELLIQENRIHECVRLPVAEQPSSLADGMRAASGGITLGVGEMVTIRDNSIERCGRSHVDPICGVYALFTNGISVERNRIIDNAPRTDSADPARTGVRGGLFFRVVVPPHDQLTLKLNESFPRQTGVSAARIVGNVIVVPEGRCLVMSGRGAMVVTDNQMTTHGVGTAGIGATPPDAEEVDTSEEVLNAFGGVTAVIFNSGISNEGGGQVLNYLDENTIPTRMSQNISACGSVQVSDNVFTLDLLAPGTPSVVSSVMVFALLDDVSLTDNKLHCYLRGDQLGANLLLYALTSRTHGNRMEEALQLDPTSPVIEGISAFVVTGFGIITENIASHCLLPFGLIPSPPFDVIIKRDNLELIRLSDEAACLED